MSFIPPLLFWLDSAERRPTHSPAFTKLPSIRSHLTHPAWRRRVPLAAGRGAALGSSLIKAVIRPNLGLWNELLSEPGVPDGGEGRVSWFLPTLSLDLHTHLLLCPPSHVCHVSGTEGEFLMKERDDGWFLKLFHLPTKKWVIIKTRRTIAETMPNDNSLLYKNGWNGFKETQLRPDRPLLSFQRRSLVPREQEKCPYSAFVGTWWI